MLAWLGLNIIECWKTCKRSGQVCELNASFLNYFMYIDRVKLLKHIPYQNSVYTSTCKNALLIMKIIFVFQMELVWLQDVYKIHFLFLCESTAFCVLRFLIVMLGIPFFCFATLHSAIIKDWSLRLLGGRTTNHLDIRLGKPTSL